MQRFKWLIVLVLLFVPSLKAQVANGVITLSVGIGAVNVTVDRDCNYVIIRQNSASPDAVWSIREAGTSTDINLAAGQTYTLTAQKEGRAALGPFKSGTTIATIKATTSGPFSFIGIETYMEPPLISKYMAPAAAAGVTTFDGRNGAVIFGASDLPVTVANNQGLYNPATTYAQSDVVQYNGSSYIGVAASTGTIPGTDTSKWSVLAAAGANGTNGVNGVNGTSGYSPNQTVQGCGIEWTGLYNFTVGACSYYINGVQFNSPVTNLTLTAADVSLDRIDTVYVNDAGTANKLTGTPSASPLAPAVDPTTQLQLSFVYVTANTSAPTSITSNDIYHLGTEWTATKTGAPINLTSTNNPYDDTKDVEGTLAVLNNQFKFTVPSAGTVDLATRNALIFYIRSKATWSSTRAITIQWNSGATVKGTAIVLKDGAFGFISSSTTAYQQISIPTSLFGINGILVNNVTFTVSGGAGIASIGFYVDDITLQGGVSGPVLPSNIMIFRGSYSTTTAYNVNDVVVSGSTTYVCLVPNINQAVSNANFWQALSAATQPYELVWGYAGKPAASVTYLWKVFDIAVTFPANFTTSRGKVLTNATSTTTFTVAKNGSTVGTIAVASSGTFTFATSGGTAVSVVAGDYFTIITPAQDATLADISLSLYGTR